MNIQLQVSDTLQTRLESYLSDRLRQKVSIRAMKPLIGGACQDHYALDLVIDGAPTAEYVLRTDKGKALDASLSREAEYHVVEAAYTAGVRTPAPFLLEPSPDVIGHPFYLMARIPGTAIARKLLSDEALAGARAKLPGELAEQLARIHSIRPGSVQELRTPMQIFSDYFDTTIGGLPDHSSAAEYAIFVARESLDQFTEPYPALELALRWLINHVPAEREITLTHGDFRTGNFMVTPDGLSGILDWEFARYGDPMEDIAWLCMRDWRFGRDDLHVGGFADREPFYRAYEAASGRTIDPVIVHYWEIFGNLRWAMGAVQQAQRHLSGADRSIELAAIGRRVVEMEFEMLYLIERGPLPRSYNALASNHS